MRKEDLKSGMVVEIKNGNRFIVFTEIGKLIGLKGFIKLDAYVDKLKYYNTDHDTLDIVAVYEPTSFTLNGMLKYPGEPIWECNEPKEMTIAEIEKELGYPIKVVK